jgi:hypothetical protein
MNVFWPDDVVPAVSFGAGGDPGGVGTGVRLGDPERLEPQLTGGQRWQPPPLLLLAAVPGQRAHRVELGVAGVRVAAGAVNLLQDDAGLGDALAPAAVLLRDEHRQPAEPCHFHNELRGVLAVRLSITPVLAGKPGADFADRVPDEDLVTGQREVHAQSGLGRVP